MTLECFLVWYRVGSIDIVVGASSKWSTAKNMAEKLYAAKKNIDKLDSLSTGITHVELGTLYMSQKPKGRWQILPLMSVDTPSW